MFCPLSSAGFPNELVVCCQCTQRPNLGWRLIRPGRVNCVRAPCDSMSQAEPRRTGKDAVRSPVFCKLWHGSAHSRTHWQIQVHILCDGKKCPFFCLNDRTGWAAEEHTLSFNSWNEWGSMENTSSYIHREEACDWTYKKLKLLLSLTSGHQR